MTKFAFKNNLNYNYWVEKRTAAGIIDNIVDRKKNINDFYDYLRKKFDYNSTLLAQLNKVINEYSGEIEKADRESDQEKIGRCFFQICHEADAIDLVRDKDNRGKEIGERAEKVFQQNTLFNFNQVSEENMDTLKRYLFRYAGRDYGLDGIAFYFDFVLQEIFLTYIPNELKKELEENPRTNFSRLDQDKWNNARNKLLKEIINNFKKADDNVALDLSRTEKSIQEVYPEFIQLIEEAKKSQDGKPDKEEGKFDKDREDALITDPQTGTNWNPVLTEGEKEIINDPNLDSSEAIQAAANLLSHLRSIRNDKANGGPGSLADWNSAEKVNKAIDDFQEKHYNNILSYQIAKENTDQGKAWKAVNSNTKFKNIAENIHKRYKELICNVSKHQTLENQIEELRERKKKVSEVTAKINEYWDEDKNQIIELKEKANVLGSNWGEKLLEKSTVEEIATEGDKLIKNIDERRKKEENKKEEYEKEIQKNVDEAWRFINNWHLTEEKANDLLRELRKFQIEWGASPIPAKYRALVEKDKPGLGDKSLSKTADRLQTRIRGERAIQTIKRELDDLNNDVDARVDQIRDLMAGNTGNNGRDRQITDDELHKSLENDSNLNPVYKGVIDWPTYIKRATTRQDLDVREANVNAKIAEIRGLQANTSDQKPRKYIPYLLQHFDLERKYNNFDRNLRGMSDEETIDDYENGGIRSINTLRPFRSALSIMLEQGKKLLDKNDNSQEAEEYRKNALDLLLKLEDYKNSTETSNKPMWLSYGREQSGVEDLIHDLLVRLREQNLAILTKWKDLLKKGKDESTARFIDSKFAIYQRNNNNRTNSQDIKNQRYEKEFQDEVSNYLNQQSQSRLQEEQQAIVQQNIPPK